MRSSVKHRARAGFWYGLTIMFSIARIDPTMRGWQVVVGVALAGGLTGFLLPTFVDPIVIEWPIASTPPLPPNELPILQPPSVRIRLPVLIVIWQAAIAAAVGYGLFRQRRRQASI